MKIALATRDATDAATLARSLRDLQIDVLTMTHIGIRSDVVEDGTLAENASKKAHHVAKSFVHGWVMAVALAPEVDSISLSLLLETLEALPPQARWRTFNVAIAVISPDGEEWSYEGKMRGTAAEKALILSYHGPLFNEVYKLLAEFR